jgi:hypothetical protein
MVVNELDFNLILQDQISRGKKMHLVVTTTNEPKQRAIRVWDPDDVHTQIGEIQEPASPDYREEPEPEKPKSDITERFKRRLSQPRTMELVTKPHPFSHKAYRR